MPLAATAAPAWTNVVVAAFGAVFMIVSALPGIRMGVFGGPHMKTRPATGKERALFFVAGLAVFAVGVWHLVRG